MTNIKRKISVITLVLALIFAMMPVLGLSAYAEDGGNVVYTVTVNGTEVGTVSDKWMEENSAGPQIFPSITQKGFNYVIAEGPTLAQVFDYTIGSPDVAEIPGATVEWVGAPNKIDAADLANAVTITKPVDAGGNDASFDDSDVYVAQMDGAADAAPVLAFAQSGNYKTYGEAREALDAGTWKTGEAVQPYVAGNLTKDLQIKAEGAAITKSVNFCGKFVAKNCDTMNLEVPMPTDTYTESISMTAGNAAKKLSVPGYPEVVANVIGGWECDDAEVIRVDEFGSIKPLKAGKCKVTLVEFKENPEEERAVIGEWTVTVKAKAKPKPGKPGSLKVKNVKTRSAALSWKKASNAEGYVVYRSLKKSSGFKAVKTIKGTKTVKYTNKKLKKGKTYYYKVRAYNMKNGKKRYGSYSSVVKVKIKK